jgi:hypothetical protein
VVYHREGGCLCKRPTASCFYSEVSYCGTIMPPSQRIRSVVQVKATECNLESSRSDDALLSLWTKSCATALRSPMHVSASHIHSRNASGVSFFDKENAMYKLCFFGQLASTEILPLPFSKYRPSFRSQSRTEETRITVHPHEEAYSG